MSSLGHALPNPGQHSGEEAPHQRARRWRWLLLLILIVGLVTAGLWAWPQVAALTGATPSAATNAANAMTMPASAPMVVNTVTQNEMTTNAASSEVAAAAALTETQATRVVVIAGTEGATLLTEPGGATIATVAVGTLLTATARSDDGAWIYVSDAEATRGWVASAELIGFGLEKLMVMPVATSMLVVNSTPVSATAVSSATVEMPTTVTTTVDPALAIPPATVLTATDEVAATGVTALVSVSGVRLNVRSGPGTNYAVIDKANRNDTVTVLARNAASDWLQIALPNQEGVVGWAAAAYLQVNGDVALLPISAIASAAPAAATTTTALATNTSSVISSVTVATTASDSSTIQPVATPATTQAVTTVSAQAATGLSGTLVFQSSPGGMIYAYNLATGQLWQLTNGFDPAISPDGKTVAFVRTAGENGLYLVNIDGSNERLIFSGRNTLAAPKWSPDGNYILFTRGDEYKECRDIGRGMCLTDKELLDQNPNFPVDDFPMVKDYESNLARVDIHGDNYRDLANLESARAADWNAAGIVYQSTAGLQITADTPDATNQLVIHDPYKPAYEDPDWQPNGGKIAFVSRSGNHREIYTVNPDGSGMVALTKPVTTLVDELPNNVAPAWSPDGQHIVFLSNRGENNSAGAWRLWVMDADGSNQQPLPINVTINYTYGNEQLVSWGG
ncbi:MAG: PD40 domain-containing protein [Caldilineaceae bacterium]|nr:PD40 domain-containing protein [Caldilineaceae bacterium]